MRYHIIWRSSITRFTFLLLLSITGCNKAENQVFYDLVENFHLATAPQEPTIIDFDTEAARRHLRGGWGMDVAGKAWGMGEVSVIEFFLLKVRDIEMRFQCSPFVFPGSPAQSISVGLNGTEIDQITLAPKMKEYQMTLPRQMLLDGSNRLEFKYGYSRRPVDVKPGTIDGRYYAALWDHIAFDMEEEATSFGALADAERETIYIPYGVTVDYFFKLPDESILAFEGLELATPSGQLQISLQAEGKPKQVLETFQVSGQQQVLPLSSNSDEVAKLSLQAICDKQDSCSGGISILKPAIQTRHFIDAGKTRPFSSYSMTSPKEKPNVVIYLVDALRADHLGCYGYEKAVSPNIDAFASDGISFKNAVAQGPHTKATVSSIFTGVWPGTHGVLKWNDSLSDEALTLAEILHSEGYSTAAFTTSAMTTNAGFEQGFDSFYLMNREGPAVNENIDDWLERARDSTPFFLYVHTIEPHAPYLPPETYRRRFASSVPRRELSTKEISFLEKLSRKKFGRPSANIPEFGSRVWLDALEMNEFAVTQDVIDNTISLYDAEIAFADDNFGAFIQVLKRRDLYNETLIIFLADHGEEFYDHGFWEHGQTLYHEVLNIPLIIKLPGKAESHKFESELLAQQIDIVPTILDFLRFEIPKNIEGQNLIALAADGTLNSSERAFSYLHNGRERIGASVIEWPWKMIWNWVPGLKMQLFNIEQDPTEQKNLAEQHPVLLGYFSALIKKHEIRDGHSPHPNETLMSEELRKKLKSLGYIK